MQSLLFSCYDRSLVPRLGTGRRCSLCGRRCRPEGRATERGIVFELPLGVLEAGVASYLGVCHPTI